MSDTLIKAHIVEAVAEANGYLGRKFIVYLSIAHRQSRQRLKKVMAFRGGYILHIDGTCEGDSPHLFTGIDGIAQIVLDKRVFFRMLHLHWALVKGRA